MAALARVIVVDDTPSIRALLRIVLAADGRFAVVGEAADGIEAVELAAAVQPDLVVLDRDMPRLDGVGAIPRIREVAPRCAIVLFTAAADAGTYQAAISAGARDVVDKAVVGDDLLDALGAALLGHLAELSSAVDVRVGPVPASAARAWIANTRQLIAALRAHPEVLGDEVPAPFLDRFERFLQAWWSVATAQDEFTWHARAEPAEVRELVEHWAAIDRLTDEQLATLGWHWSPPEGEPFFVALTEAVLAALAAHDATRDLAARLATQWERGDPQGPMSPT